MARVCGNACVSENEKGIRARPRHACGAERESGVGAGAGAGARARGVTHTRRSDSESRCACGRRPRGHNCNRATQGACGVEMSIMMTHAHIHATCHVQVHNRMRVETSTGMRTRMLTAGKGSADERDTGKERQKQREGSVAVHICGDALDGDLFAHLIMAAHATTCTWCDDNMSHAVAMVLALASDCALDLTPDRTHDTCV